MSRLRLSPDQRMRLELFPESHQLLLCGEAENGSEAIEKAQRLRPDLIVTDLSMPLMNGLVETRVLKNQTLSQG
jgi:YesN/AraC family two-component response regulator